MHSDDKIPRIYSDTAAWTKIPGKHEVFCKDPAFLLAADQVLRMCDAQADTLWNLTYILIKPDALVANKAAKALAFITSHGFSVINAKALALSEHQALNMWRYQWNRATTQRMKASLSIATCGPSIMVLLRRREHIAATPASVELWSMKGSAFASGRPADTLRAMLEVEGRYFGYVHVPDEPIDVVRELGNLLGAANLNEVFEAFAEARNSPADAVAQDMILRASAVLPDELYRFDEKAANAETSSSNAERAGEAKIDQLFLKATAARDSLSKAFSVQDWAALHTATQYIEDNVAGIKPVVDSGDIGNPLDLWAAR